MENENVMIMSQAFANEIMDALAVLYLCANEVPVIQGEDGEPTVAQEHIDASETYARDTYLRLCDEWEAKTGKSWQVVIDEEEEE